MAILKIARMGHPVLLQSAAPVADPTAPEIRRLVADMIETMEDAQGAGLAAPQVHMPLRLFVFRVNPDRATADADDTAVLPHGVVITPVVAHPLYWRRYRQPPGGWRGHRVSRRRRAA